MIGEEWVLAKDKHIFNVVRHEIAHQIYENILSKKQHNNIQKAFMATKKNGFIRKNSSLNESEYFADGVTFYFNKDRSTKIKVYDMGQICNKKLLAKRDKFLYDIIGKELG